MQMPLSGGRSAAHATTLALVLLFFRAPAAARQPLMKPPGPLKLVVQFASCAALRLARQRFAVFTAAIPVLSSVSGWIIVGDAFHAFEPVAAMLVSAGVALAGFSPGAEPGPTRPAVLQG